MLFYALVDGLAEAMEPSVWIFKKVIAVTVNLVTKETTNSLT